MSAPDRCWLAGQENWWLFNQGEKDHRTKLHFKEITRKINGRRAQVVHSSAFWSIEKIPVKYKTLLFTHLFWAHMYVLMYTNIQDLRRTILAPEVYQGFGNCCLSSALLPAHIFSSISVLTIPSPCSLNIKNNYNFFIHFHVYLPNLFPYLHASTSFTGVCHCLYSLELLALTHLSALAHILSRVESAQCNQEFPACSLCCQLRKRK